MGKKNYRFRAEPQQGTMLVRSKGNDVLAIYLNEFAKEITGERFSSLTFVDELVNLFSGYLQKKNIHPDALGRNINDIFYIGYVDSKYYAAYPAGERKGIRILRVFGVLEDAVEGNK